MLCLEESMLQLPGLTKYILLPRPQGIFDISRNIQATLRLNSQSAHKNTIL